MVQFLSINVFSWISSNLLGFSKVPVFLCHSVYVCMYAAIVIYAWVAFLVRVRKQRHTQTKTNYPKYILCFLNCCNIQRLL